MDAQGNLRKCAKRKILHRVLETAVPDVLCFAFALQKILMRFITVVNVTGDTRGGAFVIQKPL